MRKYLCSVFTILSLIGCDPDSGTPGSERTVAVDELTEAPSIVVDAELLAGLAPGERLLIDMNNPAIRDVAIDTRDRGLDLSLVDIILPGGERWTVSDWIEAGTPPPSAGFRCNRTTISFLWGIVKIIREENCASSPDQE